MALLAELQDAVAGAAERVGPAVVGLGHGWGFGSGVVIGDRRILTSAHNVRGDEVPLTFADERQATGRVLGVDLDGDLAVVEADTNGVAAVEWGDVDRLVVGAPVFALARPGGRGLRVTFGLVSVTGRTIRGPRGRRITGGVEHTAPLPRGSSGGPLVDGNGRLLGLNTIRLEGGLILALGADSALRERAEALGRGESPARRTLGLAIAPSRAARRMRLAVGLPERDGLLVRGVEEGSPGARAGIERGELIVAAAGAPVTRVDDLYETLDRAQAGATLELALVRGTDERSVVVSFDGAAEAR
jgi:S1-C subfamily serine protease